MVGSKTICECGMLIRGRTDNHLKNNLRSHKKGSKHKELIKLRKEIGSK